jgi:salicylate hydroxylase
MIGAGWLDIRWGLFVVQPPLRWHRGRAVLIGDAAHAMLPHQGQGANQTIEDAITLASFISEMGTDDLGALFDRYEGLRRTRTRKVQRSSWVANRALHLPDGPALEARNARVSRFPEDFGWIHAFDALREAELVQ